VRKLSSLAALVFLLVSHGHAETRLFDPEGAGVWLAPDAVEFRLANGMQVVVIPDQRAPVVTQMVWYRVGAADETAGQSGAAHFLEHLMFKGTTAHPGNEFDKRLAAIGGEQNAFTSSDYTVYFERVAVEYLGEMMMLEADRMTNLVLTDKVVAPERDVVLNERLEDVESQPEAKLDEALLRLLYINHPYGRPVLGWSHEIRALTPRSALDLYKRHYAPNNAVLIVAGDVRPDDVRKLAEGTYGRVPARPGIREPRPIEPSSIGLRTVTVFDEVGDAPQLERAYVVPSASADAREAAALSLLAQIMGGGATSRFYDKLVRGNGPATKMDAYYEANALDHGRFRLEGLPKPATALSDLEAQVEVVIKDLQENGVTQEELERAKRSVLAEAIFSMDDQEALATRIGEAIATGQTLRDVQNWPTTIQAVTTDEVTAAARRYLLPDGAATGYLKSR
jgi:zinc protease